MRRKHLIQGKVSNCFVPTSTMLASGTIFSNSHNLLPRSWMRYFWFLDRGSLMLNPPDSLNLTYPVD